MAITPLITAAEAYPALEQLAANAEQELILSFRIFDHKTPIMSPDLLERGLNTWADLIHWVARKGVVVRIILSDFDPVFTPQLHRSAWLHATGFADGIEGDVQILCAPHHQKVGKAWTALLWPMIRRRMRILRDADSNRLTPVQREVLQSGPMLRPATLHQKCAVADGEHCIIGGIDVNPRRYDDNDHQGDAEQTWHDVSLQIDGRFADALRSHLIDTWNAALEHGQARSVGDKAFPIKLTNRPQTTEDLRLLRTMSLPRDGAFAFGPRHHITENEDVLIKELRSAKDHIYIETQFLRHKPVADAILAAGRASPVLQLIIVMPPEPERILFDGHTGWDARHAHALQSRLLHRLRDAFGDRLALISPAQAERAPEDMNGELEAAGPVYVHSKVTLIDGRLGIVGSANLNGRSLRWDTEASVAFTDPDLIQTIQSRLARKWLGIDGDLPDVTRAKVWNEAAQKNAALSPEKRAGFVLPYPLTRARKFSRLMPILPNDMF